MECNALLEELKHLLRVCNRDNTSALLLYEKIASIYFEEDIKLGPESLRDKILGVGEPQMIPDRPSKPEKPPLRTIKESEDKPTDTKDPKKTWFERWIKWW